MHLKVNESLSGPPVNNLEFKSNVKRDFFIGKIRKGEKKISKYISKCVNCLELFDINLVFLSVTSGSITNASFILAVGALVGLITSFNTIFFTSSNGFVKLFFIKLKK